MALILGHSHSIKSLGTLKTGFQGTGISLTKVTKKSYSRRMQTILKENSLPSRELRVKSNSKSENRYRSKSEETRAT